MLQVGRVEKCLRDTVKIGVTQNLAKRIATIENASGLTVRRHFKSKPLNDADYIPIREKIQFLLEAAKLFNGDLRTRLVLKVEALIDGRELDDFDDSPAADFVTDFIDRHCVRDKNASVSRPQLIRLISERCPEAENTSNKFISGVLDNIPGLKKIKTRGTICLKGIRLLPTTANGLML